MVIGIGLNPEEFCIVDDTTTLIKAVARSDGNMDNNIDNDLVSIIILVPCYYYIIHVYL